jgi:predicted amidohydrolase
MTKQGIQVIKGTSAEKEFDTPARLMDIKEELTIALCQLGSELADTKANLAKADHYIEQASKEGADLIAFPEMYLCNYMAQEESRYVAEPVPGPSTQILAKTAERHNIYIVMGMPTCIKEFPGLVRNSAVMIGPKEGIMGVYSKLSLPTFRAGEIVFTEGNHWTPGNNFPLFKIKGWDIAVNICYDCCIPETPRVQALQGAQILLTLSAGPTPYARIWDIVLLARAVENQVFQCYCNVVGSFRGVDFFGGNRVINPGGEEIVKGPMGEEALVIGTVNINTLYHARCNLPSLRPGYDIPFYLYERLLKPIQYDLNSG